MALDKLNGIGCYSSTRPIGEQTPNLAFTLRKIKKLRLQPVHRNPLSELNPQPNQTRSQAAISSNRTVVQSKHRNPLTELNPQPNQTQSQITLGSNNMTPKKRGRKRLPRDENEFFKFVLEHIQRLSKNKSELSRLLLMVLVPYRTKSRFGVCSWSSGQRFTLTFYSILILMKFYVK
ncbi:hypothetical protein BpHYR1_006302 [Brachionus plicatilis]|uniref:Uncharacterized protein n=1 Tax=Brachionus plicatilis TaxID=10195 RepID=A0A3M7RM16_BRAPC|nr:hypothetical protein BpHYR1_006302 [Brachionus plicatilis]